MTRSILIIAKVLCLLFWATASFGQDDDEEAPRRDLEMTRVLRSGDIVRVEAYYEAHRNEAPFHIGNSFEQPLLSAVSSGNLDVVRFVLDHRRDSKRVNLWANEFAYVLIEIAKSEKFSENLPMVRLLVEKGANIHDAIDISLRRRQPEVIRGKDLTTGLKPTENDLKNLRQKWDPIILKLYKFERSINGGCAGLGFSIWRMLEKL